MAGRGRNISYTAQEEPTFIRQFKEKIGYKEDPSIEDKFSNSTAGVSDDDSGSEPEENKPQVIVLRKGDLTAEEAEQHVAEQLKKEDDEEEFSSGRIMFKKPIKRASEHTDGNGALSFSNKRTKKEVPSSFTNNSSANSDSKKLDNTKLLSFDADDDDEDS